MTVLFKNLTNTSDNTKITDALARCGHCERCVLAVFVAPSYNRGLGVEDILARGGSPNRIAPSPKQPEAPPYTDEDVAEFFKQGERCLPDSPDAAAAILRKALEAAMQKILIEEGYSANECRKLTLYKKIEAAHEKGRINDSMKDWADSIRILGNEAAHSERFSLEKAQEVKDFTEVLFQYLYTLPEKVRKLRKEQELQEAEDTG